MTDCPICADDAHSIVKCQNDKCDNTACISCWRRWLLRKNMRTSDPVCMVQCGTSWTEGYLIEHFSSKFLKKYLNYRIDVCNLEFEAMLPEYRKRYAAGLRLDDIHFDQKKIHQQAITAYKHVSSRTTLSYNGKFYSIGTDENPTIDEDPQIQQNKKVLELAYKFNKLNAIGGHLQVYIHNLSMTDSELQRQIRKDVNLSNSELNLQFNGHCPNNKCDKLLFGTWKCVKCASILCSECLMEKLPPTHTCKVEDVLSANMIKSDSKPCPQCKIPIFKIQGCNDMYCTQCKIFFCWRTLKIIRGYIPHNPHAETALRQLGISGFGDCRSLDMFNWGDLQDCFIGYSKDDRVICLNGSVWEEDPNCRNRLINKHKTGKSNSCPVGTKFGKELKILFHIVRELDMHIRSNIPIGDTKYKHDLAMDYIKGNINLSDRGESLWNYKMEVLLANEIKSIRMVWVNSVKSIILNHMNPKLAKNPKKGHDIKEFQKQIRLMSIICRMGLIDISTKFGLKSIMICPKHEDTRFKIDTNIRVRDGDDRWATTISFKKDTKLIKLIPKVFNLYAISDIETSLEAEKNFLSDNKL